MGPEPGSPGCRAPCQSHTPPADVARTLGITPRNDLDDGSRPDHARLKQLWQLAWSKEDGISTMLPYDGGIHRVGNPDTGSAISVHLYGPRLGKVDGRDYYPSQNYVCDRPEIPIRA